MILGRVFPVEVKSAEKKVATWKARVAMWRDRDTSRLAIATHRDPSDPSRLPISLSRLFSADFTSAESVSMKLPKGACSFSPSAPGIPPAPRPGRRFGFGSPKRRPGSRVACAGERCRGSCGGDAPPRGRGPTFQKNIQNLNFKLKF